MIFIYMSLRCFIYRISDSLSVLLSLEKKKLDNPLVVNLLQKLHLLSNAHETIFFCCIPSHICIRGFLSNKSQNRLSSFPDNKLFKIKPTLGEWPSGFRNSRKVKGGSCFISAENWSYLLFTFIHLNVKKILLNAQHVRRSTLKTCFN